MSTVQKVKTFAKLVGKEIAYRPGSLQGQQMTTFLLIPCEESDVQAIQTSPLDCVAYSLWKNNNSDLWYHHRYRIVDAVPETPEKIVPWN